MWMSLLSTAGVALLLLAAIVHSARNAAHRRKGRKRATLMRLRLQDQPSEMRPAYREIPIRLG
jgi:hypothetical protein